ncbi:sugar kinase [Anaerolineales bacterium HSG6]|nr:sugar kinase [Anaerolineales bacterium HSG6]MDM8529902.1 sugar kinase [Anaerolineales bacterium HSG25]
MLKNSKRFDVLTIGETLVDFISTEETTNGLLGAANFGKYLGGSPANIAVYVSKLGGKSAIISKTGIGVFGQFLKGELQYHGVNTDYMIMDHRVHTSFIFVSRSQATPDFEPYRNGDYKLTPQEVAVDAISRAKVVHASTWGPSREPCRSAIKKAFWLAKDQGKIVSFDPNYSPIIWPDYQEAQQVLREIYRYATITKPSLDDAQRLFGAGHTPEQYIEMFHELGPETVVLTMGGDGSIVSHDGNIIVQLPARPIKVVDVTGAGDSYWAGFLVAMLDGHPLETCARFARELVELKLTTVGPLPSEIDRQALHDRLSATNRTVRE